MEQFRIKEYGRTELAQAYSPAIAPASAWKKLRRWMCIHPTLMGRLSAAGYTARSRCFTPAQVRLIVDALGEP